MGKTNALLNLINQKLYTDKIRWYTKSICKAKYQYLINKRVSAGLRYCNDPFIKF